MNKFFKAFEYPFDCIKTDPDYRIDKFTLPLFDENFKTENINLKKIKFPKHIVKVYWYQPGTNDETDWEFIGKIKYTSANPSLPTYKYVYYTAGCDYTGFDCQGEMKMYIFGSLCRLLKYGVPSELLKNKIVKKLYNKCNNKI